MANTFYLGSSPLGLFNTFSRPNRSGMATFNAGNSRNLNVFSYNTGKRQDTNISWYGRKLKSQISLFTGSSLPKLWPNIGKVGTEQPTQGTEEGSQYKGLTRTTLHNNDVYDVSILNIIEKLSPCPSASLKPQDFAYLKYLGVYPHNRLMIARRFGAGVQDNILSRRGSRPISTLISWNPDTDAFLTFNFGEAWMDADADFTELLNKMGEDVGISNLGAGLDQSLGLLPLPGFTETIRRKVLENMGVLELGEGSSPLPSGNPNIIKMAKRRKTIGYGESGSGLKFKISIKMVCEYEQKFISGIDPTIVFMDILHNILVFGTQNSSDYGVATSFKNKIDKWTSDASLLIDDMVKAIKAGFKEIGNQLEKAASDAKKLLDDAFSEKVTSELSGPDPGPGDDLADAAAEKKEGKKLIDKAKAEIEGILKTLTDSFKKSIEKYHIELIGVANALSGAPSTPWHITVGNPLRPIYCSGDMYTDDLAVTLGPHLAFNDLPVNFRVEFTLQNARPLGLQEIMGKFNTGHLRTVNIRRDVNSFIGKLNEAPFYDVVDEQGQSAPTASTPDSGAKLSDNSVPSGPNTGTQSAGPGTTASTTKEGGVEEQTNKDANSNESTTTG